MSTNDGQLSLEDGMSEVYAFRSPAQGRKWQSAAPGSLAEQGNAATASFTSSANHSVPHAIVHDRDRPLGCLLTHLLAGARPMQRVTISGMLPGSH